MIYKLLKTEDQRSLEVRHLTNAISDPHCTSSPQENTPLIKPQRITFLGVYGHIRGQQDSMPWSRRRESYKANHSSRNGWSPRNRTLEESKSLWNSIWWCRKTLSGNQDVWPPVSATVIEKTYVEYIYVRNRKCLKISGRGLNCKISKTLHVVSLMKVETVSIVLWIPETFRSAYDTVGAP